MATSIVRQSIGGRVGMARHPIATKSAPSLLIVTFSKKGAASSTWTAPASGLWQFGVWGPGGRGSFATGYASGGSGALIVATRSLAKGQAVTYTIGVAGQSQNTTLTLPSGEVLTAGFGGTGSGSTGTPGAAAATPTTNNPNDVCFGGTVGNTSGAGASGLGNNPGAGGTGSGGVGGPGAPGNGYFQGGDGGTEGANVDLARGCTPGGGGASGQNNANGGDGAILAILIPKGLL